MNEAQWNRCKDPQTMLAFLIGSGNTSERKLRLFAVACCRRIWPLIRNPKHKIVIEAAERYADGDLSFRALQESLQLIGNPQHRRTAAAAYACCMPVAPRCHCGGPLVFQRDYRGGIYACGADRRCPYFEPYWGGLAGAPLAAVGAIKVPGPWPERYLQCRLLRDLCLPSQATPVLASRWLAWHDRLIVSMAQQMYDSRDFSDMPILADALEEAGCSDQDILGHCRGPGPHARGCWVVDAILGKT
jgi:hypothetical protein